MFEPMGNVELLASAADAQRAQRSSCARQLIAVGTYALRRMDEASGEHDFWCVDDWDVIAAEVAAELGISRGRAVSQMSYGKTLIERLPQVGQVFLAGDIDFRVFAKIDYRTALITDREILARIDAEVARRAPRWNRLSDEKVAQAIDWLVVNHDPEAVRIARQADDDRHIEIELTGDGMADVWGRVRASDGLAFDRRVEELAATVCEDDPRTKRQRRTDAMGAVALGQQVLACTCGSPDCPAGKESGSSSGALVIHLIAEEATVEGEGQTPGFSPELGSVPAEMVRDLAPRAKVRPLVHPGDAPAEPQYRPSAALAEFVRVRDLTCRFPGCDCPAERADIDHTVPYPFGPTHASNLKLLCRFHHLMKTFYASLWNDRQLPDGTVIWTAPNGATYTTKPHGALFFPQLAVPTGDLVLPTTAPPAGPDRELAMPMRRRTREQNRGYRVEWERAINRERYAADPPPF